MLTLLVAMVLSSAGSNSRRQGVPFKKDTKDEISFVFFCFMTFFPYLCSQKLLFEMNKMILLSFDTEEFDVPREHGVDFTLEQGMAVSKVGTNRILDVLKQNGVRATFFCTGNFAEHAPEVMQRIMDEGHEVACHGVDHWQPKETDFARSKEILERVTGRTIYGYRQPRMFPVVESEIKRVGYRYNSSLNPAFIPGRYMHLTEPRTWFMKDGVMQIPASVTPLIRFPLFWLALHNLPEGVYHWMVRRVLKKDGYFFIR